MGSNTEVEGRKTSPESGDTLTSDRFFEAIGDTVIRELTISTRLLLLDFSLDVVEWERANGCCYGRDHR